MSGTKCDFDSCDQEGIVALTPNMFCERHAREVTGIRLDDLWRCYQEDSDFLKWRLDRALLRAELARERW